MPKMLVILIIESNPDGFQNDQEVPTEIQSLPVLLSPVIPDSRRRPGKINLFSRQIPSFPPISFGTASGRLDLQTAGRMGA